MQYSWLVWIVIPVLNITQVDIGYNLTVRYGSTGYHYVTSYLVLSCHITVISSLSQHLWHLLTAKLGHVILVSHCGDGILTVTNLKQNKMFFYGKYIYNACYMCHKRNRFINMNEYSIYYLWPSSGQQNLILWPDNPFHIQYDLGASISCEA